MPGKILNPDHAHKCFPLYPPEAGLFARLGTRWQCDDCHTVWELAKDRGWVACE